MSDRPAIALVGGTGKLGLALARRWAKAGYRIIIGSRDAQRAADAASALAQELHAQISGDANRAAARSGDIVVVTVPYANHETILQDIAPAVAGKIVVDATVPLVPPKVARVQLPVAGSAATTSQAILGDEVRVVSAFHNVAAHKLATDEDVACDVLVFGNSKDARAIVVGLVEALGLRGLHGGSLANSAAAEAMTSVLIFINRMYGVDGAGVQITGELIPPNDR
ncbi:MAG: NADPH-dependent F420 reductase [Gammaproteobacteria bacterium]